jgi:hypothetical protein
MTLREQIADDIARVFTRLADFGEPATYVPKGGQARPIVAVIDFDDTLQDGQGNHLNKIEVLRVLVSRDPTSGIDSPQFGDALARDGDDPDLKAYSFTGEITDSDDAAWTLTFVRNLKDTIGGNRMPR